MIGQVGFVEGFKQIGAFVVVKVGQVQDGFTNRIGNCLLYTSNTC